MDLYVVTKSSYRDELYDGRVWESNMHYYRSTLEKAKATYNKLKAIAIAEADKDKRTYEIEEDEDSFDLSFDERWVTEVVLISIRKEIMDGEEPKEDEEEE